VHHLEPMRLEVAARRLPEADAGATFAYLDSLTARQQRDLAGTRDRLAILAESDAGRWLDPATSAAVPFELLDAVRERAVVYFRLDADRRPLLGQMLGAAIVQDLLTTVSALQVEPIATIVVIDEFSAVAAEHVGRLFGRARSAGMSMVLGTQELSDLRLPGRAGLADQVLGNVGALIAHRQVVPDSAGLIADVAGSQGGWVTAQRPGGEGTRTRVRVPAVHPDQIKALPRGYAVVVVPGGSQPVRLTRVLSSARHL
jgi:type IV secretory pathway TraG/TraD family ATPase VirD4